MPQYDGSIRIGTGIDEKGFKAGSKELEAGARSLAKSVSDSLGEGAKIALQKQTDAFVKLNQQYAAQEQKVKEIASRLHDVQRQKVETAEFKELSKDLDKAKTSLDRLYDRRDSYVELGKKVPPKLDLDISDAERKIRLLEGDIKELKLTNKAYVPVDTTKVQQELAAAEQKQMQIYAALQTSADAISQKTSERIAKEDIVREKIAAEVAEEERLDQIRVNAVKTNDEIIAKVERIKQLEQEIANLEEAETTLGYADYEERITELSNLKQAVAEYRDEIINFQPDKSSEAWKKYQATLEQVRNAQTGLISPIDATKATLTYMVDILKEKMLGLASAIKNGVTHPLQTLKSVGTGALKALSIGLKGIISALKITGNAVLKICSSFKKVGSFAKKAFSAITSGSKQSNVSLSGGLKTILKYGVVIRSLYVLFNKMRNGIKEGFTNLMGYSDDFANSIQSVKNSMKTLGNQIAAAFAPIVQMVVPWINQLISTLSTAMTYVAQFIAALTGSSTFTKATQIQDKYNKSLGGTAKAADKARGALAKFDDLDVLQKQEDTSGGGGVAVTDPADMFEEVGVSDKWKNIADWFREMWENSDFYSLGKLLGEKLKEALENIDWEPIKETAKKIGTSLATLINGFIEIDGLGKLIGKTLGEAINTGIDGINAFLDNTHWDSLGKFIGEALNGIVDAIEWDSLGHFFAAKWNAIFETIGEAARTFDWKKFGASLAESVNTWIADFNWSENGANLGELIKGLLDTLISFLEETDWQKLGNSVADFIGSIDWTGIFERLSRGLGAALGGLSAFLFGLIEDAWNSVVKWWNEVAYEDGKFTMEGLLNGISEVLANIGTWIYEHIFVPFIEGFRNAFGIHSPSTVMAEIGGFLIEGLKNGILGAWESLKETVGGVASSVLNKFRDVFDIHSPSAAMDEDGAYLMEGLYNGIERNTYGITELFNLLSTSIIEILTLLNESVFVLMEEMGTHILEQWNQTLQDTELVWKNINDLVIKGLQSINTNIIESMTLANTNWAAKWAQMLAKVKEICAQIVSAVSDMNSQVQSMCAAMIAAINAVKAAAASLGSVGGGGGFSGAGGGGARAAAFSMAPMMADIPQLASGAVIRGGNPFMAILGDQPHGQTNIETPANLIKDMVAQGIAEAGIGSRENVPVNINIIYDGETTARVMIPDILSELGRQGYNVDLLGYT